jgi:hypothetical protein
MYELEEIVEQKRREKIQAIYFSRSLSKIK